MYTLLPEGGSEGTVVGVGSVTVRNLGFCVSTTLTRGQVQTPGDYGVHILGPPCPFRKEPHLRGLTGSERRTTREGYRDPKLLCSKKR